MTALPSSEYKHRLSADGQPRGLGLIAPFAWGAALLMAEFATSDTLLLHDKTQAVRQRVICRKVP